MTDNIDTAAERKNLDELKSSWSGPPISSGIRNQISSSVLLLSLAHHLLDALDAERAMTKRVTRGWTQTVDKYHDMQARAEKAEAERDTAWNDAIEAAKGCVDDNHPFSIMAEMDLLKKGDSHNQQAERDQALVGLNGEGET